jgi:Phage integrase, N-terminal SAM-like domain
MAKRRGNGEGTISRRKDGRWEARYTAQTANGPKRKVLYGKTREEVAKKLTKAMSDRDEGLVFDDENLRVEEFLNRWLNDSVRDNVRPRTLDNYRLQVCQHIVPALGKLKLKNLSPARVQGFYRSKLDAGLKPSTVRYIHAVLHRALKQAVRRGLVPRNVTEAVDIPKLVREEINALPRGGPKLSCYSPGRSVGGVVRAGYPLWTEARGVVGAEVVGRGPGCRDTQDKPSATEDARRVRSRVLRTQEQECASHHTAHQRCLRRPQEAP